MNYNNPNTRRRKSDGLIPAFNIRHSDRLSLRNVSDDALYVAGLQAEVDKLRVTVASALLIKGALTVNLLNSISPQTSQAMQAIITAYAQKMINEFLHTKEE